MSAKKNINDYSVPALERGFAMLELLSRHSKGLSLAEIARELDLPQNGVFRIGQAMVQMGYLHRDEENKRFTLSRKLLELGLGAVHECNIVERAYETLVAFRDEVGEFVALGTLLPEQGMGVILATLESAHWWGYFVRVGFQFHLHCSGPGKALLAFLPETQYRQIRGRLNLLASTPNTITDLDRLDEELKKVRENGFAIDREEYVVGCLCISAPVLNAHGFPVAAIYTAIPKDRLDLSKLDALGKRVKQHAESIAKRIQRGQ